MFKVEMDEENYRLVGPDGEEGPIVPYGQMATLTIESAVYYANVEDGNEDAPKVYVVTAVKIVPAEVEDVQFEVTEEDDSDDGAEEDGTPEV
jgi:hypothetical protein